MNAQANPNAARGILDAMLYALHGMPLDQLRQTGWTIHGAGKLAYLTHQITHEEWERYDEQAAALIAQRERDAT